MLIADVHSSPLDCNHQLPYWISWLGNTVTVGQASYPSNELLRWEVPENLRHDVNFIAFATGPETARGGQWEISETPGVQKLLDCRKNPPTQFYRESGAIRLNADSTKSESHHSDDPLVDPRKPS